ncbi:MAG: peptidase BlaR1, partial [Candidatus Aminicenantes bacterium]|nr:peptidase BlaR1 [Candidatus Aminicenantes bacterium]
MVGYLLKTTVVLTLALLAAVATRRRSAALRHFILSFALIGLLLLPVLSFVPFGWRTSLIPAGPAGGGLSSGAETSRPGHVRLTGPGALSNESDSLSGTTAAAASITYEASAFEARTDGAAASPAATAAGAMRTAGPAATEGRTGRTLEARLNSLVKVLWPAGLVILLFRLAAGLAGAVRLTAEGTSLGGPGWRALLERFLKLVSLRRPVRLKSHPEVMVPLTWGWRKPVVLFPAGAEAWTDDERSSALLHELSHIKRADFLVMLLVRTSLALYWWNPLCWVAYRELLKAQEIACDELVLRAGIRPSAYAASLLAFRRSAGLRWNPSTALLGMLGRSSFQERLASILRQKIVLMEVKMKTKIMLAVTLVAAVCLVGMARPTQGAGPSEGVTVLAETALPAPATPDAVIQETAVAQEKAKTQEKAKAAEKAKVAEKAAKEEAAVAKTIVIEPV